MPTTHDVRVLVARSKTVVVRGVSSSATLGQFKAQLARHRECAGRPASWIQLSSSRGGGALADDSRTLEDYGVGSGPLELSLRPPMESQTQRSTLVRPTQAPPSLLVSHSTSGWRLNLSLTHSGCFQGPGMAEASEAFRLRCSFCFLFLSQKRNPKKGQFSLLKINSLNSNGKNGREVFTAFDADGSGQIDAVRHFLCLILKFPSTCTVIKEDVRQIVRPSCGRRCRSPGWK